MRPSASAMTANMKEIVMKDCGLTSGQILAICDKISEKILKTDGAGPQIKEKQSTPVAYAKTGMKRISKLLNQGQQSQNQ